MTAKALEVLETLKKMRDLKLYRSIDFFSPYPKQQEFFDLSSYCRESLIRAGNQFGKSTCGAVAAAYHATGLYPDWWLGKRFEKANRGWIAGEASLVVRDVQQKKLFGEPGVPDKLGTGFVPRSCIVKHTLSHGVTGAFDTVYIKHIGGGTSTVTFKSYEQGRDKFQGEPVDWIWLDEEAPMPVYSECLARLTATRGIVFSTFTAMLGRTALVDRFEKETPGTGQVIMTYQDALHIPKEEYEALLAKYPPHERIARVYGGIMSGSGAVFAVLEENLKEPQISEIPKAWAKLWAVDFGIAHPFAAVLLAWDRDKDVVHILHTIRMKDAQPLEHATAMKLVAAAVPVAWPHDGNRRDTGSLVPLAQLYRKHGLSMLASHATFPDGSISTEAGIAEMTDRMKTGRLKVAAHLSDWFEEFRGYHRKDGLLVKERDDLMSATRIGIMALRMARPVNLGGKAPNRRGRIAIARGTENEEYFGLD